MYRSRITVLKARGIPIGINYSWLLIVAFLIWSLGAQIFPRAFGGMATSTYMVMAVAAAALFFVSVVLHELGHAFRALKEGMQIEGITLWLFGGVASFVGMFPSAGAELRVAAAGPAVSAVLAAGFAVLAAGATHLGIALPVRGVLVYLVAINLLLLAFNLVPALPLDGGRILQALIWRRRGSFASATRATSALGQGFGVLLTVAGLSYVVRNQMTSGLWLCLLGIFVVRAARSEAAYGILDSALRGTTVRELLGPNQLVVSPGTSLAELLVATAGRLQRTAYPVAMDGKLLGVVTTASAGAVPASERVTRTVGETMTPPQGVPVVEADSPVLDALARMQSSRQPAAVTEGGAVSGMVSVADVTRALQIRAFADRARRMGGRRKARILVAGVLVAAFIGLGVRYHPPFYVLSPGPVTDISHDFTITGQPSRVPAGKFLLVTVYADQHTLFGDLAAGFHPHRTLVPTSEVGAPALEDAVFNEDRVLAAAAAGRQAGLSVTLGGSGALVTSVVGGTPAAGVLRTGDLVVAVDGQPVHTEFDLEQAASARPAGTSFSLTVQRAGRSLSVHTISSDVGGQTEIGANLLTKDLSISQPFQISFVPLPIGGPSAGLVYSLAISDALGTVDTAGATVAATGTIDLDGNVGEVGDVDLKAIGAKGAGATLFIVPAGEVSAATGVIPKVEGVISLQQALAYLRANPAK